jgi:hypothetical protein
MGAFHRPLAYISPRGVGGWSRKNGSMFFLPKRGGWVVSALGLHITPGLVVCFFCPELAFKLRCLVKLPVRSLNPNHRQGAARVFKAKRAYEFAAAARRGAGS